MTITPFQSQKLLFHRTRIDAMLRGELVFPVSVEIDLSNVCNHDCPFCSFGTKASQGYRYQNWVTFPYPRITTLLDELKACGVESVTFTGGGEPLMHKQALQVFRHATEIGLQWGLVTNGALLVGEVVPTIADGATFVRISLDAGSDETHQQTHGVKHAQYSTILRNMGNLRLATRGRAMTIGASFCVMDRNLKEIYKAAKDVRDAGANYLEVRPTFPTEWRGDGWAQALSDAEAAKTETDHARMHLNSPTFSVIGMTERFDNAAAEKPVKAYSTCRIGPLTTVIGADGRLWHCCIQRGQSFFELGTVLDKPFAEVWEGIHQKRDASKIDVNRCPRCRYDGYNEILEHAVLADGMHRSFV
jgi:cyclic pyranopterin phosphate synthase